MEKAIIIVAGGQGKRMQSRIPKQFLRIGHELILMRTLQAFHSFDPQIKRIVVLPEPEMATWERLCREEAFGIDHVLVAGGKERFHSVKNGLEHAPEEGLIGVHDGVRPLVSQQTIEKAFRQAEQSGNAVPVRPLPESIRRIDNGTSQAVDREKYRLVQTPQVFDAATLKKAYRQPYRQEFTDDASLVENMGIPIHVVEGNEENIKITTQKDLELASILLDFFDT